MTVTDAERRVDLDVSPEGRTEFGPKNIDAVPFAYIKVIEQVRTVFSEEGIAELANSMILYKMDDSQDSPEKTVVGFNMHNPLIVAKLTRQQADQYFRDHADFYNHSELQLGEQIENTVTAPDGFVYVLIAGERRTLAIRKIINDLGLDDMSIDAMCSIQEGIDFMTARQTQMGENIHARPSVLEEAENIRLDYNFLMRRYPDRRITFAEVAESSGRSASVVRSALLFTSLPQEVQDLARYSLEYTDEGQLIENTEAILPYSTLIALKPLEEALRAKHQYLSQTDEPPVEDEQTYVTHNTLAFANYLIDIKRIRGTHIRADEISKKINEKILKVQFESTVGIQQLMLNQETGGPSSQETLDRSRRRLGVASLYVMHLLADSGTFNDGDLAGMFDALVNKVRGTGQPS